MATLVAGPGPPALVSLPRQAPARYGALPVPLTPLVGREKDLEAVTNLLAEGRLVTLVGPGGAGKTRLVLHAAADVTAIFADGVASVDLAPVRDPAHVLAAIAEAAGCRTSAYIPYAIPWSVHWASAICCWCSTTSSTSSPPHP